MQKLVAHLKASSQIQCSCWCSLAVQLPTRLTSNNTFDRDVSKRFNNKSNGTNQLSIWDKTSQLHSFFVNIFIVFRLHGGSRTKSVNRYKTPSSQRQKNEERETIQHCRPATCWSVQADTLSGPRYIFDSPAGPPCWALGRSTLERNTHCPGQTCVPVQTFNQIHWRRVANRQTDRQTGRQTDSKLNRPNKLCCGPRHNTPRHYSLGGVNDHYFTASAALYSHSSV